jgi:hypothetical protein
MAKKSTPRRRLELEPLECRKLLATYVSGSVEGVWDLAGSPYILQDATLVEAGKTLTIESGVEVQAERTADKDYIFDFNIDGTVNVTDAAFVGYTDVNVRDGGTLNLTDTTVEGGDGDWDPAAIEFREGAQGTVTGSTFSIPVHQYSGTKATPLVDFHTNTFQAVNPIYTYAALVEDFTDDNTFNYSGGTSQIYINHNQAATTTEDATWSVSGTAAQYVIGHDLTVASGTTLTISAGVEVSTLRTADKDYIFDFNIDGTVNVTDAAFVGYTDVNVRDGGTLNLTDTTVEGGDGDWDPAAIEFREGAQGTVTGSTFSIPVHQYSGTKATPLVDFHTNTFQAVNPIYTYAALVEDFTDDNTFNYSGGTSQIYINHNQAATTTEDATWSVSGTAAQYVIGHDLTVASGTTLTISAGVEVSTLRTADKDYIFDFNIDGTVNVTDAAFVGYTDVNVRDGGTLNLTDTTVEGGDGDWDPAAIEFREGAQGTVTGSTFSIPVHQYSGTKATPLVDFHTNTFQAVNPIYTYAALVEDFTDDNTFNYSGGTSQIYINHNQAATTTEDATWSVSGTAAQYVIGHDLTVASGTTLTISAGVEVSTLRTADKDYIFDFNIDGTVNVTDAAFVGYTDVNVRDGGTLNLTDTTVEGGDGDWDPAAIEFREGAQGTVTGSTFSIPVHQYSGTKATPLVDFHTNTFQAVNPIYTYAALVEDFTDDNTFNYSGGTSQIYINHNQAATLSEDATWSVSGTAAQYVIGHDLTVASGTTLTISAGVEVSTLRTADKDYIFDFNIDGTVNVTDAAFVGYTDINVRNSGSLNLLGSTFSGASGDLEDSSVDFQAGAMGRLDFSQLALEIDIHSDAFVEAYNNDFSAASVVALGDSADTIDLRWNWWGSTNPDVIGNKITDQLDDATRPLVLIDPWLEVPPMWVPTVVDIADVAPDPRETTVDEISIVFSRPVQGFGIDDLELTVNGGPNLLSGAQTLTTDNDMAWTLGGLSAITTNLGSYTLSLAADESGITDPLSQPLNSGATDSWWHISSPLQVSALGDHDDGDYTPGQLNLREAVDLANAFSGPNSISFDPALADQTIELSEGELKIQSDVHIVGLGRDHISVDAGEGERAIYVDGDDVDVMLDDITIITGAATGLGINGRGIFLRDANLALRNVDIIGSSVAAYCGGGIFNDGGALAVAESKISDNLAYFGGAIFNRSGAVIITNSHLVGNTAQLDGGAMYVEGGELAIDNSAVVGNTAENSGGGVYQSGGSLAVRSSTIAGNQANEGGGIRIQGGISATSNSIVAINQATLGPDVFGSISGAYVLIGDGSEMVGIEDGVDGNIVGADPQFYRNPTNGGDGWGDDLGTSSINEAVNDDYGDLRLGYYSVAVDVGSNALLPVDWFDLDDDENISETIPFDLKNDDRIINATVDMGAYENDGPPPARDDIIGRVASSGDWWIAKSDGTSFTNEKWGNWSSDISWEHTSFGDFNGDGQQDIAGRDAATGQWYVSIATSDGFVTEKWSLWSTSVTWENVMVGDFNGDGMDDIIGRVSSSGDWWVAESTGTAFANAKWGRWSNAVTWLDVKVADFDGDGDSDIAGRVSTSGDWWVASSTGTAFANAKWSRWTTSVDWVNVATGDFNGDGSMDLVGQVSTSGSWYVATSTGAAFTNAKWSQWSSAVDWVDVSIGDFNGDGLSDLIGRVATSGKWYVATSTGSSFTNAEWGRWSTAVTWLDVQVGDFDGDGQTDIAGRSGATGDWNVARSVGDRFVNERWGRWSTNVDWVDVHVGNLACEDSSVFGDAAAAADSFWSRLGSTDEEDDTDWTDWLDVGLAGQLDID